MTETTIDLEVVILSSMEGPVDTRLQYFAQLESQLQYFAQLESQFEVLHKHGVRAEQFWAMVVHKNEYWTKQMAIDYLLYEVCQIKTSNPPPAWLRDLGRKQGRIK